MMERVINRKRLDLTETEISLLLCLFSVSSSFVPLLVLSCLLSFSSLWSPGTWVPGKIKTPLFKTLLIQVYRWLLTVFSLLCVMDKDSILSEVEAILDTKRLSRRRDWFLVMNFSVIDLLQLTSNQSKAVYILNTFLTHDTVF